MSTEQFPVLPSILSAPSLRQGLFARDRAAWWTREADAYRDAGDLVWEARCRNEAAFWEADAPTLAELLEAAP